MLNVIKKLFDPSSKILKEAEAKVPEIRSFIEKHQDKSQDELLRIIANHRESLEDLIKQIPEEERDAIKLKRKDDELNPIESQIYSKLQEIYPEVYAILAITTDRKLGIMHYDVQLQAASILATGQKLVEMKTGEGKTNTFHLPLFLYGLTGRGAHLVTVNDYLARRDGEYAGHIFSELGVKVGIITPQASYKFVPDADLLEEKGEKAVSDRKEQGEKIRVSKLTGVNLKECSKKEAYACDVVIGTNNEFGFDYLRDNMVMGMKDKVQGELYFCIVDEADSILIDEARTPLIISAPASKSNSLYQKFAKLVPGLKKDKHFVVEEKERAVNLTDEGITKMEKLLGVSNIWEDYSMAHHLENALKANVFYEKDKEYIVRDGQVMIVDEFTGRVLPGRRYSEGLHQAIEAKESVEIQQESRTIATITFQNFFRIYKILGGGSGTIMTEQEEFYKIYGLESAPVPTNVPVVRKDLTDRVYKTVEAKFNAVAEEIEKIHSEGQPILVGTTSIDDSEKVSRLLDKRDIPHEVLNAKYHEREAQIVAKAGELNSVTVATNMAGRGTDIPLGEGVVEKGGLFVIGTERHEARRIDNQLRGRSGRQGDPGTSRFFVSLEDQIMRIQGGDMVKKLMEMTNLPDDMPLESRMINSSIERAQKKMEGMYFDSRKRVVEYDDVVNQQREIFYQRRIGLVRAANNLEGNKEIDTFLSLFSDAISSESEFIANVAIEDPDKAAELFMGTGIDDLFIKVINELKLSKDPVSSLSDANKVLAEQFDNILKEVGKSDKSLKLTEFVEKLYKIGLKLQADNFDFLDQVVKIVFIQTMDELWTLHLDFMQDVREGIGLRQIAQLDPLVEYKNEGFKAFKGFVGKVNREALQRVLQLKQVTSGPVLRGTQEQITNSEEIEDLLTGDRELFGSSGVSQDARQLAASNASRSGSKLSRKQRRKIERENKRRSRR